MRSFVLLFCLLPIAFSYIPDSVEERFVDYILSIYDAAVTKNSLKDERMRTVVKEITLPALNISLSHQERKDVIVRKLLAVVPNTKEQGKQIASATAQKIISIVQPMERLLIDVDMEYIKMLVELGMERKFIEGSNEERKKMLFELIDDLLDDMEMKEMLQKKNTVSTKEFDKIKVINI